MSRAINNIQIIGLNKKHCASRYRGEALTQ